MFDVRTKAYPNSSWHAGVEHFVAFVRGAAAIKDTSPVRSKTDDDGNGSTTVLDPAAASAMLLEASGAAVGPLAFAAAVPSPCEGIGELIVAGNTTMLYVLRGPTPSVLHRQPMGLPMKTVVAAASSGTGAILLGHSSAGQAVAVELRLSAGADCALRVRPAEPMRLPPSEGSPWTQLAAAGEGNSSTGRLRRFVVLREESKAATNQLGLLTVSENGSSAVSMLDVQGMTRPALAIGTGNAVVGALLVLFADKALVSFDFTAEGRLTSRDAWPISAIRRGQSFVPVAMFVAAPFAPGDTHVVVAWNSEEDDDGNEAGARLTALPTHHGSQVEGIVIVPDPSTRGWQAAFPYGHHVLALRQTNETALHAGFELNMLVIGQESIREQRRSSQRDGKAQCFMNAYQGLAKRAGDLSLPQFLEQLQRTHTDTYMWDVTDGPTDYPGFVAFLNATASFLVDGRQLRVWLSLVPPAYDRDGNVMAPAWSHVRRSQPPPDLPSTDFNHDSASSTTGASSRLATGVGDAVSF